MYQFIQKTLSFFCWHQASLFLQLRQRHDMLSINKELTVLGASSSDTRKNISFPSSNVGTGRITSIINSDVMPNSSIALYRDSSSGMLPGSSE